MWKWILCFLWMDLTGTVILIQVAAEDEPLWNITGFILLSRLLLHDIDKLSCTTQIEINPFMGISSDTLCSLSSNFWWFTVSNTISRSIIIMETHCFLLSERQSSWIWSRTISVEWYSLYVLCIFSLSLCVYFCGVWAVFCSILWEKGDIWNWAEIVQQLSNQIGLLWSS